MTNKTLLLQVLPLMLIAQLCCAQESASTLEKGLQSETQIENASTNPKQAEESHKANTNSEPSANSSNESKQGDETAAIVSDTGVGTGVGTDVQADEGNQVQKPEELTEEQKKEIEQLKESLKLQYAKLREIREKEGFYSPTLGEELLSYGILLRKSKQFDEAQQALIDAIHIYKVNNGIYSAAQLTPMRELFLTYFEGGDIEESEDALKRIRWVETQAKVEDDATAYDLTIKVIHAYLDLFYRNPNSSESSIENLLRAKHHIGGMIKRYKSSSLDEKEMPYGEMALVSFYQNQLHPAVDKTLSVRDPMVRSSNNLRGNDLALASYMVDAYPRGNSILKGYLRKAVEEENLAHIVKANILLGDFQLLFEKNSLSAKYYKDAWQSLQELPGDHELANMFSDVVPLPAFDYLIDRQDIVPDRPRVLVPMKIRVDKIGRVIAVHKFAKDHEYSKYFFRAKRAVRAVRFRPKFVNGEAQGAVDIMHSVPVLKRR